MMENEDYGYLSRNFLDEKGRLISYPAKRKMKVYTLYYLAGKIDSNKVYSEAEFNDLLDEWHTFHDPATLRRELCAYSFIEREKNGSMYKKAENTPVIDL